jgi:hypothetical protein
MAEKLIASLKAKESVFDNGQDSPGSYVIKSSFSVPEETRKEFNKLLGSVDFTSEDSFHGISLEKGGRRLEWTIEGWIESFGSTLEDQLEELRVQGV